MATLASKHVAQFLGRQFAEIEEMPQRPLHSAASRLAFLAASATQARSSRVYRLLDLRLADDQGRQETHDVFRRRPTVSSFLVTQAR